MGERGHGRDTNSREQLTRSLIVTEKERLVLYDRTANHEAELIAAKNGLVWICGSCRREQVASVEPFISEELESRSMKIIRARLGREINYSAIETSKLPRRTITFYL